MQSLSLTMGWPQIDQKNGIDAIIGTTVNGFIIGLVYLKTDRNIWAAYVTHAVANTVGFLIIYLGLYKDLLQPYIIALVNNV